MTRYLLPSIVALALAACGGSSGGSSPTSPTSPTTGPPIPAPDTCNALGGTAIYNGAECSAATSSVVLINLRDTRGLAVGACSGTVIAPQAILTAAHCLDDDVALARVWLGAGDEIVATSFVHFPGFAQNNPSTPDVGLVFVGENLPRAAIPLLTSRDARVGETAIVAGWGRDAASVTALLRAGSTVVTAVGGLHLQTLFNPPLASICSGDSGGPILLNEGGGWAIGGISSATSANVCNTGTNFYVAIRNAAAMSFVLDRVPSAGRR